MRTACCQVCFFARIYFSVIAHRALFATSELPCARAFSHDILMVPAEVIPPLLLAMCLSKPFLRSIALLIQCRCRTGMLI